MIKDFIRHPALTARFIVRRIGELRSKGLPRFRRSETDDFDLRFGVETAKYVQIVPTQSRNFSHGNRYSPAPESAVRWSIENCGLPTDDTTFVDVGSGKGRVLIIASTYPFRKIIGVEYSPELAAICQKNLSKVGAEKKCEVICGDAADFVFPDGNLLAFLYNPFDAFVLDKVLKNLAGTSGRTCVAQLGPGHDVIHRSGLARQMCSGDGPTLYEIIKPN